MLYVIQVYDNDVPGRERGLYIRFFAERDRGTKWSDARWALGCRLIKHLQSKGHKVIRP